MHHTRKIHDMVTLSDSLKIETTNVKTGRTVVHQDNSDPRIDTQKLQHYIQAWVEHGCWSLPIYLSRKVAKFRGRANIGNMALYRGISLESFEKHGLVRIGPSSKPKNNRYSKEGEIALYLISESKFIAKELNLDEWMEQHYKVNLPDIRIADITQMNHELDNSIGLAFHMSERGVTNSGYEIEKELNKRGKSKHLYSQLLARFFKRRGWQGLLMPGVRGDKGANYSNLVLFMPLAQRWDEWTVGDPYKRHSR